MKWIIIFLVGFAAARPQDNYGNPSYNTNYGIPEAPAEPVLEPVFPSYGGQYPQRQDVYNPQPQPQIPLIEEYPSNYGTNIEPATQAPFGDTGYGEEAITSPPYPSYYRKARAANQDYNYGSYDRPQTGEYLTNQDHYSGSQYQPQPPFRDSSDDARLPETSGSFDTFSGSSDDAHLPETSGSFDTFSGSSDDDHLPVTSGTFDTFAGSSDDDHQPVTSGTFDTFGGSSDDDGNEPAVTSYPTYYRKTRSANQDYNFGSHDRPLRTGDHPIIRDHYYGTRNDDNDDDHDDDDDDRYVDDHMPVLATPSPVTGYSDDDDHPVTSGAFDTFTGSSDDDHHPVTGAFDTFTGSSDDDESSATSYPTYYRKTQKK